MAYTSYTGAILRGILLSLLGDDTAGTHWKLDEVERAVLEATAMWYLLTGEFTKTGNIILSAGSYTTAPPATSLKVFRITLQSSGAVLTPTTLHDMDQGNYNWRNGAAGTPSMWAEAGSNLLYFDKKPAGNTTLVCEYYDGNLTLVDANDYVELDEAAMVSIIDYAQAYLQWKDGVTESTDIFDAFMNMFMQAANRKAAWLADIHPNKRNTGSGHQVGQSADPGDKKLNKEGLL